MGLQLAKIFKQAIIFTKTKPFLWGLGLFLIWANLLAYWVIVSAQQLLENYGNDSNTMPTGIAINSNLANVLGISIIVFFLVLLVVYFYSRVTLAMVIKELMEKKSLNLWSYVKTSKKHIINTVAVWIISFLLLTACAAIVFMPVGYLMSVDFTYRAGLLASFGIIILLPISFFILTFNTFAGLHGVLLGLSLRDSMRASLDLITRFWPTLLYMSVSMFCISFLTMLGVLFVQVLIMIPFVILSGLPYDMVGLNLNSPYIISGVAVGFLVLLFLTAIVSTFQHISWILVFLELVKPKKVEEAAQAAIVPEVV